MEVSLKNYEILNAKAALDKLSEQEAASIKTVYALSKISKEVAVHAKDLEEFKEKLVNEFAVKDEEGRVVHPELENGELNREVIKLNKPEEFHKKVSELLEANVSFSLPSVLTIDMLETAGLKINANDLNRIDKLLSK